MMYMLMVLVMMVAVFAIPANKAGANPDGWPSFDGPVVQPKVKPRRRVVRRKRARKKRRAPAVRGAVYRASPVNNGFTCAREFSITGDVKATEERARQSAWAAYHGEVKFELGERFADGRFAKAPRFECARSTSETTVSKTVEAISGGGGVYRYRCRLRAIACKPPEKD